MAEEIPQLTYASYISKDAVAAAAARLPECPCLF